MKGVLWTIGLIGMGVVAYNNVDNLVKKRDYKLKQEWYKKGWETGYAAAMETAGLNRMINTFKTNNRVED